MDQRNTTAQPWADLDPGSGSAVIVPFPTHAVVRRATPTATPATTPTAAPADPLAAAQHCIASVNDLRRASLDLAAMLQAMSVSARALEENARAIDARMTGVQTCSDRIAESSGALAACIKRFNKRLVAIVHDHENA